MKEEGRKPYNRVENTASIRNKAAHKILGILSVIGEGSG